MKPDDLMRDAARLLETALVLLDTSSTACPHCGRKHFTDIAHARVYEQFSDAPERLRRAADRVAASTPKRAPSSAQKEETS